MAFSLFTNLYFESLTFLRNTSPIEIFPDPLMVMHDAALIVCV